MNGRIFTFELNGKRVLGFDTGLSPRAFAQAKMTKAITQPGFIVRPEGGIETWRSGGVAERETMIVWGPLFSGEPLSDIVSDGNRKDEALGAVRFWLKARASVERAFAADAELNRDGGSEMPFPGLHGAFVAGAESAVSGGADPYPEGSVFFPPPRLFKRGLDAEGSAALMEAERSFHPDLEGSEGASFSAGVALYRIFSGVHPFSGDTIEELHENIREGNFIPPRLAVPGLNPAMASLISRALTGAVPGGAAPARLRSSADASPRIAGSNPRALKGPVTRAPEGSQSQARPAIEEIITLIEERAGAASWIKAPSAEESAKLNSERAQYARKKALSVKTRRFVFRNTAIIAGIGILLALAVFTVWDLGRAREGRPSTLGMTPPEVAEAYYRAFGELDHAFMEACVSGKTGDDDIETAASLYVIAKMREAYEGENPFISAEEWLKQGRPETGKGVLGVADLRVSVISANEEQAILEADYTLWLPDNPSGGAALRDILTLAFQKDRWRVTEIARHPQGT